jgi:hypothetical protein
MFGPADAWQRILNVNLWGIINGSQIFAPGMIARGRPGVIINTGSKQGITTPPGDPAYNVAKAGVKAFTEALAHTLRNTADCQVSAHLLIPGFVFTALTAKNRVEKPEAAWTPEQTVDFMIERLAAGDFYILCPDNDVPRALDERRILWAAGDIVENRPALSRWHPDYADAFAAFAKGESSDRRAWMMTDMTRPAADPCHIRLCLKYHGQETTSVHEHDGPYRFGMKILPNASLRYLQACGFRFNHQFLNRVFADVDEILQMSPLVVAGVFCDRAHALKIC